MKKLSLSISCLLFSALVFTSCGSEESAVAKTEAFKFEKTPEMLNFETALKSGMKARSENRGAQETSKAVLESEAKIASAAKTLLVSIGVSESEYTGKNAQSTHDLVRFAADAYSKKLTQMYNQRKNKN